MHEEPEAKFESSSKQSCRASGDETETFSMLISRIPRVNALPAEVGLHVSESRNAIFMIQSQALGLGKYY